MVKARMGRIGLAAAVILLLTGSAFSQLAGPTLMHPSPEKKPAPVAPRSVKACTEYGAGFVRMDGTAACVKIGGYLRVQRSMTR
jgi:hypothetical protein